MFHLLTNSTPLPSKLNNPFGYTPHPLCVQAVEEVQAYLSRQEEWKEELSHGKMFGVLVVQTPEGKVGYLAAFSGILAGRNVHSFFVPPVYDLLQPDGFFKQEESEISAINRRIDALLASPDYLAAKDALTIAEQQMSDTLSAARREIKAARGARKLLRTSTELTQEQEAELVRESQFQNAEYKRLERSWKEKVALAQERLAFFEENINTLKAERKSRSAALQQRLFTQFRMLNARGEVSDLMEIFSSTSHPLPPAGAGECCAPKLLQCAYLHGYRPVAMAEFWWGASPKAEIRRHGQYYPACKGKCEPILNFMLQGLEVEENPHLLNMRQGEYELETVYEDEHLLVLCKPSGLLTVPSAEPDIESVCSILRRRYPEARGSLIVHRLDMDTSGLLVATKNREANRSLQMQFERREVKKRYIALLDGVLTSSKGVIDLPLCPDPLDRPRQIVNYEYGKPSVTDYEVLAYENGRTRIAFSPRTGRTHQLRVHAAHSLGLGLPIVGDVLYGAKAERLCLHAETLGFVHPVTGEWMEFHSEAGF